jgi:hypothetical protein
MRPFFDPIADPLVASPRGFPYEVVNRHGPDCGLLFTGSVTCAGEENLTP